METSLNKRFSADKIIQLSVAGFVLSIFNNGLSHNCVQFCAVEEAPSVRQNVFWLVVQALADEQSDERLQLGVLPKVLFVGNSQLQLLLFDLSFLRADDAFNANQIVVVDQLGVLFGLGVALAARALAHGGVAFVLAALASDRFYLGVRWLGCFFYHSFFIQ